MGTKNWPQREPGWEEALQEQARRLFAETAERHRLEYRWDPDAPVEIACVYPEQPGLEFELWMSLQWDLITCGGEDWRLEIFPADLPENWQMISDTIDGLITGRARILLYTPLLRSKPYWTVVQLQDGKGWHNVSTGLGCAVPPVSRLVIVQNGQGRRTARGLVLAWGCLGTLLALAALSYALA